ncbi:MAG TPA: hypothetical protein VFW62_13485, partial [bacterium]|nr:hypothetical protein [bacterium]
TAFVVMSALSTGTFLAGGGLTLWSGLRYGKAVASDQLLRSASQGSETLFEESGELSQDARSAAAAVPGLLGMLHRIEARASAENQDVQSTIEELRDETKVSLRQERKFLVGSAIGAGVGLVGMLIFISAAKIARHRGLMLHGQGLGPRGRRSTVRAQVSPAFSPQMMGLSLSLRL